MAKRAPVSWRRSDRMVAAYLSQLAGGIMTAASALLLADQAYPGTIPRWLLVSALVVTLVSGGGVAVSGRGQAKRRVACGLDPARPEAPIHSGRGAAKEVSP